MEVWQRKKRQFLCERPESLDWSCHGAEDDLRETHCTNKNHASLIETLKADIECGWGAASKPFTSVYVLVTMSLLVSVFTVF